MAITLLTDKVFVQDIGTIFRTTVKEDGTAVDISTATTKQIIFQPPSGVAVAQTAVFFTDGSDGIMQYVTVADDLNIGGIWRLQGFVVLPTWQGHGDQVEFKVYDNLT